MTLNNFQASVEASNPSKPTTAEQPERIHRHPPTPRQLHGGCSPSDGTLTLREAARQLRRRHPHGASDIEINLLAIAWLGGQPLDVGNSEQDRLILRWAIELMEYGLEDARVALAAARAAARASSNRLPTHASVGPLIEELTLEDALHIPQLSAALGLDKLVSARQRFVPNPTFVPLQRHELGPHAAELWGPPTEPPTAPTPTTRQPAGILIGTCMRCAGGVGDKDWTFAAWDGNSWRFSGYTLPEAGRLAVLRPLLCCSCAVRVKYKLIPPPDPLPSAN